MSQSTTAPACGWHAQAFFGIHYDLHAQLSDTELGRELTHDHLRERLLRVRPDWVQCDCKGHNGYTSWPTTIGTPSPGIVRDGLRIHRDVTRELGIRLGMHYSGVWDTRAIELHPEWACVDVDGNRSPHFTCRMSSYDRELLIPQMLELIEQYDVDGFWVDGESWAAQPCWCERCGIEFRRRTGLATIPRTADEQQWTAWLAFHRDLFVEHVIGYTNAIHARKPECQVCSNWMYTVRHPDPVRAPVDYLSGDYDWAWGADRAAVEGRVLDSRGISWDLMAWAFTKTNPMDEGPPWTVKTPLHLCQELAEVIALGGAVMVYDQPQRSGWLSAWHQDVIAEAAAFCRARQEVCFQSRSLPQVALLHLADHYYAHNQPLFNIGDATQPLEGALHALLELHRSVDILTEEHALLRLREYPLVVVPEQTHLSPAIRTALEEYVVGGGRLLISGVHVAHECAELTGATPDGDCVGVPGKPNGVAPLYLPLGERAVAINGPWQPVLLNDEGEVWAIRLRDQEPQKDTTTQALVTARRLGQGLVVAAHGGMFNDYYRGHYPLLRQFIGSLIERMNITWAVEVEGPARLELTLRQGNNGLLVNLINRGAGETLSPRRVIIEELPPITDIVLRLPCQVPPTDVRIVPASTPITWEHGDGHLVVRVPRLDIHAVVVIASDSGVPWAQPEE